MYSRLVDIDVNLPKEPRIFMSKDSYGAADQTGSTNLVDRYVNRVRSDPSSFITYRSAWTLSFSRLAVIRMLLPSGDQE